MHIVIVGRTMSGKSSLAKEIGSELRLAGQEVLAFNPICESGYTRKDDFGRAAAEWETDNPEAFAAEVQKRIASAERTRYLIIDEGHEFFTRAECAHLWIGTKGRHYGLNNIIVTQRAALLNPTVRGQCGTVYLFQCSLTDARFLADEYGNPVLSDAPSMPAGQYLKIGRDGLTRGRVF